MQNEWILILSNLSISSNFDHFVQFRPFLPVSWTFYKKSGQNNNPAFHPMHHPVVASLHLRIYCYTLTKSSKKRINTVGSKVQILSKRILFAPSLDLFNPYTSFFTQNQPFPPLISFFRLSPLKSLNNPYWMFKAVLKCRLNKAKLSNALLKLIFWRKRMKFGRMIVEVNTLRKDVLKNKNTHILIFSK